MLKLIAVAAVIILVIVLWQKNAASKASAADNIRLGAEFLAHNATLEGVQTTPSGLQYKVLNTGTGSDYPKASDTVKVHYHGTLIDGTVFDSSVERGQPIDFGLHQVIAGWTEGLQLMVVGQTMRLFIPSQLAYGNRAAGSITPGSTLIFDVELLAIN